MTNRLSLTEACEIAKKHGGECLSSEYKNNRIHMLWRCSNNHIWSAPLLNIKYRNDWCSKCKTENKLKFAKELAHKKGGECLSTEYYNNITPMLWSCAKGHQWRARFHNIRDGTWCPICLGRNRTIRDMQTFARAKNGDCISDEYYNTHTKLEWRCNKGHTWMAQPNNIIQGRWCPYCPYKLENLCREIVTKYLGPPSKNRRPDFLKTSEYPKGLELDIPYYDYGFAIEIQAGSGQERFM
ncbi:3469_t:CDS:2 [Entrophospora sp. SA101]|nr:3469_t:CDS:2 [Entrophospora sp. SA101]CAJ0831509.1 9977_t:CDS:2 [Entrophospora sp. SA101]